MESSSSKVLFHIRIFMLEFRNKIDRPYFMQL